MRKIKKVVFLGMLCFCGLQINQTFAETAEIKEEQVEQDFSIEDGVLVKYKGTAEHVMIPDTVTVIGKEAFDGCETIKIVVIPDSVIEIKPRAFYGCMNMTEIQIPDSVKKIGEGAFMFCRSLKEVRLPNPLKTVEQNLFFGCKNLKKVEIPDSVVYIDIDSFFGCDSLEVLDIPKTVKRIDGHFTECPWLREKQEKNPLVIINGNVVNGRKCSGKVTIPKGVTRISSDAFYFNKNITSIIIPNTVAAIGEGAFISCTYLTEIEIPNSVKHMGIYLFEGCKRLKKVKLSERLEVIPEGLFDDCKNLRQITLPKSVKKIELDAFGNCDNLQDIVLSSQVKESVGYNFSYPEGIVLHAPKGSYIENLAKEQKVAFQPLAINKKSVSLKVNKTVSLNVGTDTTFTTWKSSNSAIAKVSKTGKVTAKKKGTATITGTLYGKKYTCKVVVK